MEAEAQRYGAGRSGGGAGTQQACGARTKRGAACRSFALPGSDSEPQEEETDTVDNA